MSFLQGMGGAGAAMGQANSAATGLGHLFDADPSRISMIADRIGKASNGIAAAGGAENGYDGSAAPQNNYLQTLDPTVMRALIAKFGPAQNVGYVR